ncbi:MAG: alpha-L-rhamnosidase C-terminal domain-containing protein [Fimbriimonadales bacterium]
MPHIAWKAMPQDEVPMGFVAAVAITLAAQGAAQWIWAPGAEIPPNVYFRRPLTLPEEPASAQLSITCDNAYELYVNGEKLASNGYWYTMQAVDLRGHLHRGRNILAVAGRNFDGPAGLLVDGSVRTKAGIVRIVTDASWRIATKPEAGWKGLDFGDSSWTASMVIGPEGIQPWGHPTREADALRDVRAVQPAKPASVRRPAKASPDVAEGDTWPKAMTGIRGRFVRQPIAPVAMDSTIGATIRAPRTLKVDFGREIAGWVEVEVEGTPAPDAKITVGEAQTLQGPFPTRAEHIGSRTIYRLLPTGAFTGFRFAWIEFSNVQAPVKLRRVEAIWRMWPANYEGTFECSDLLLNRIWHIGAYTAHLNLDPVAFSAILRPERGDRIPWMGDDRVTHRTVFNAFGDYDLVRADLDSFVKPGQKAIALNGIPGYTLDWVIALYDYWMYSGDRAEVGRHLADVHTILQSLDTQGTPPGWLFTDWEPGLQSTSDESVLAFHCKYVQAARLASLMARSLGSVELSEEFSRLGQTRTAFLESRQGWPDNLRQHELTNALLAGFKANVPDGMAGYTATPYFTYYVLEALSMAGQDAKALDALRTYWGGMIHLGATSTWEYFQPKWAATLKPLQQPIDLHDPKVADFPVSLCHPWSSGATAWLSEHILGVTPSAPGFSEVTVRPFFGKLAWGRGSVPTPRGPVRVSWSRSAGSLTVQIQSPAGVRTHLILPGGGRFHVDGKRASRVIEPDGSAGFRFQDSIRHTISRR